MNVAIYGASQKRERYSKLVYDLLKEKGYNIFPIHPKLTEIEGTKVYRSLSEITEKIDTITMYVSEKRHDLIEDDLLNTDARRVVFNPGTENQSLQQKLEESGKLVVEGCSLVMLKTGQW
ncbi:MAG: CoA-binding protein [Spirochaetes bacterium]|nr:CoA-binding protein [Spirochaetota bacterium]